MENHKRDISSNALGFQTPCDEVFGPQNIPKTLSQEVFGRIGTRDGCFFHCHGGFRGL